MPASVPHLTKSAFKLARTCSTKLYYYLNNYPTADAGSEYAEVLKKGGHFIGRLAQLMYQDAELVAEKDLDAAFLKTRELLLRPEVTIFEATFISENKLAKVDVLKKKGNSVELIEVKSKSIDGKAHQEKSVIKTKNGISSEWIPYIEDVAFQGLLIKELYPEFNIRYFLLLPDKSKVVSSDGFGSKFKQVKGENNKLEVLYEGEVKEAVKNNFLGLFHVSEEVLSVQGEVDEFCKGIVKSLSPKVIKIDGLRGKHCKECEFRVEEKSGFRECWGKDSDITPSVFDLWYGGSIKDGGEFLVDVLIRDGKFSLYDFPVEKLKGVRSKRQLIQINNSKENKEWISEDLKGKLSELKYPIHFVDFETARPPIPYHAGMRPFDQVAFQWSLHTLESPGSEPVHKEWIHTENTYPNFRFAASLKEALGDKGSILTWASHELLTLKDILRSLDKFGSPGLTEWLNSVPERIVDMEKLCQENYFHPKMKGKTSLKAVLPCVWPDNSNPYDELPVLRIDGTDEVVKEGTGAIVAYNEMVYMAKTEEERAQWEKLLLQYCKLDTYAMVVIYRYWVG